MPLQAITRVAVFRALQLGDMLVAVPALRALRAAFPRAHLTLVGQPWAHELALRLPWLDGFLAFPGYAGLPERDPEPAAIEPFFDRVAALNLDLAVQLHGSGQITNEVVDRFGAHQVAGFHPADQPNPDPRWFVPWPASGREAERLMQLPLHLGAPHTGLSLEFPLQEEDHAELERFWASIGGRPREYVCVHPGARWRSRRWPAERFAAVADALRARGHAIVLTGSAGEAATLAAFRACVTEPPIDASARTSLGGLAALIKGARLLVCNDTGVAHLAAAVGTRSVIVCSGADAQRWAPLDASRHRMLHHDTACRPCTYEQCPTGHECALAVSTQEVLAQCLHLLEEEVRHVA
jgi:ADP-heptose:LPS heptosyltransferase